MIFSFISLATFSAVRGCLLATQEHEILERENAQVHAFFDLCRRTIEALPSGAELTLEIEEADEVPRQILTISGVPGAFAFGDRPLSYEDIEIGLQLEEDLLRPSRSESPLYRVSMSREDLIDEEEDGLTVEEEGRVFLAPDDEGRYWLPLLRRVQSLRWRFWDEEEEIWDEEWEESGWPEMIELEIMGEDRTIPARAVFRVPSIPQGGSEDNR